MIRGADEAAPPLPVYQVPQDPQVGLHSPGQWARDCAGHTSWQPLLTSMRVIFSKRTLKCVSNELSTAHLQTTEVTHTFRRNLSSQKPHIVMGINTLVVLYSRNTGFVPSTSVLVETKSFSPIFMPLHLLKCPFECIVQRKHLIFFCRLHTSIGPSRKQIGRITLTLWLIFTGHNFSCHGNVCVCLWHTHAVPQVLDLNSSTFYLSLCIIWSIPSWKLLPG